MADRLPLEWFWAKLGDETWPAMYHPVVCHLIDVGQVAAALWRGAVRKPVRERVAGRLGLPEHEVGAWAAFWAAAHDIGKVTPCFQFKGKTDALRDGLRAAGFTVDATGDTHHTVTGTSILCGALTERGLRDTTARKVAACVGGHHGTFPTNWDGLTYQLGDDRGSTKWAAARKEILDHLARLFGVPATIPCPPADADQSVWMYLAGLTAVADWIGSNVEFFRPHVTPQYPRDNPFVVDTYFRQSGERATEALEALGWLDRAPPGDIVTFEESTGFDPRALQVAVTPLATGMAATGAPRLLIVEAPMGEGKTEAAWYVADCWDRAGGAGTYVALPTMATSNQMFTRVRDFARTGGGKKNLMLLHGKAALNDQFGKLQYAAAEYTPEGRRTGVVAEGWFAANKKHGLLAPFGVGTIDQSLLAVLQTKHAFVRLFGLAGKCVILDEVHAYDAYMTTLMKRLLEWLAALGCPVVLLSATLPAAKRRELLAAYAGCEVGGPKTSYPCVTSVAVGACEVAVTPFEADGKREKAISLNWVGDAGLVGKLKDDLSEGGCAAVIRNTVGLAQETFRRLRAAFGGDVVVELFHARFPFGRRDEIETGVLARFGKAGGPADRDRRILVATQVIEQSLDLDFDVMYTDVAPVDLVLQRAGRLHRHERGAREPPRLTLIAPGEREKDGLPDFGPSEFVYARFVLLRSLLALRTRPTVVLPDDIEQLVGHVYGESFAAPESFAADLEQSQSSLRDEQRRQNCAAMKVMLWKPGTDDLLEQPNLQLREDDPEAHEKVRAATRDTEPSVQLVLVYHHGGRDFLDPECQEPFDAGQKPDVPRIRRLLLNEVSISHRGCVAHYSRRSAPAGWVKCGMLQNHRVVRLDITSQPSAGEYPITYDRNLGIEFVK